MYQLRITKSFKIDYKKLTKSEAEDTDAVIKILLKNERLETKYHDHALRGNYIGYRECHVRPDLLLVYKKTTDKMIYVLTCIRISTHTNIFDTEKRQR